MAYVNLGQIMYPIGAIYASSNSTSPATLFGGSWSQITNAALRGATSVGYVGSDTHILTINEMPSHSHKSTSNKQFMTYDYPNGNTGSPGNQLYGYSSTVANTGGGQHTPMCNAPTIAICGNVQAKSSRGDVAWPTSTLDKLCTQLEHIFSPIVQQALRPCLEELGQLLMREDSSAPQVRDIQREHKAELQALVWFATNYHPQPGFLQKLLVIAIHQIFPFILAQEMCMVFIPEREQRKNGKEMLTKIDRYIEPRTFGKGQLNLALGRDA